MKPLQDYRNLDTLTDLQAQLAQAELEREQAHGRREVERLRRIHNITP